MGDTAVVAGIAQDRSFHRTSFRRALQQQASSQV